MVKMKLTKRQKIGASMIGSDANLSTVGVFQMIEDAITEFMGELKIDGLTVMKKYNAFWVFAKTHVKILKKLQWGEECTVTAFISSMSLAKLYEDVKVYDGQGNAAIYARVELCALDIATQRIRKIATVGVSETMLSDEETEEIIFGKFPICELPLVEQMKVRSTNIDRFHHTNNVEYIRFIMNTYSTRELETKDIKEVEIVYCGQSYEDSVLDVLKAECSNKDLIVMQTDGKPVIKCEITFSL